MVSAGLPRVAELARAIRGPQAPASRAIRAPKQPQSHGLDRWSRAGRSRPHACFRDPSGASARACSRHSPRELFPVCRRSWKWNPTGRPAVSDHRPTSSPSGGSCSAAAPHPSDQWKINSSPTAGNSSRCRRNTSTSRPASPPSALLPPTSEALALASRSAARRTCVPHARCRCPSQDHEQRSATSSPQRRPVNAATNTRAR